jgi:peptidoglycan/LPS O-acetylase OafA/YrhL
MRYIKGLDTLRAFAVFFVIISHWWLPIDEASNKNLCYWLRAIIPNGAFGVILFFVLSGFLITSILLNAIKEDKTPGITVIRNFLVRRAIRILPIYYIFLFVLVCSGYPFVGEHIWWFVFYSSNILIYKMHELNPLSHTWSLSVEEQFYLVWPWLICFVKEKYLKVVFSTSIVGGLIVLFYIRNILHDWTASQLMPPCMTAFGIGGYYAYLIKKGQRKYFINFMWIALPLSVCYHFYWSFFPEGLSPWIFYFLTMDSIISIWLIDKVVFNRNAVIKKYILENPLLNKAGQISYGIYLFHFVLPFFYDKMIRTFFSQNGQLGNFFTNGGTAYFIRLLLLFFISWGSFYWIEKPIMRLKMYFDYNPGRIKDTPNVEIETIQ